MSKPDHWAMRNRRQAMAIGLFTLCLWPPSLDAAAADSNADSPSPNAWFQIERPLHTLPKLTPSALAEQLDGLTYRVGERRFALTSRTGESQSVQFNICEAVTDEFMFYGHFAVLGANQYSLGRIWPLAHGWPHSPVFAGIASPMLGFMRTMAPSGTSLQLKSNNDVTNQQAANWLQGLAKRLVGYRRLNLIDAAATFAELDKALTTKALKHAKSTDSKIRRQGLVWANGGNGKVL